uniref:Transcription initiation factor TFIID subunit 8 n=1 Tax=Parastrongyloides trichosuri TaxID=131310 RepID=A0A0N4ZRG7_PARTI
MPSEKKRQNRKRANSDISVSDEEKGSQGIDGIKMPISELLTLCQTIADDTAAIGKRKGSNKLAPALKEEAFTLPLSVVEESFKNAYRYATRKDGITYEFMANAILQRFTRGDIVTLYPDFPKKPCSLYNEYLQICGHTNLFTSPPTHLREAFTDTTNKERLQAQVNYEKHIKEYNEKLEKFLSDHDDELNEEQKIYTRKLMVDLNKPTKKRSAKAPKKTAFDFFKQAKSSKFADLSEEAREKKFLKAFKKLKPEELEIYESLASNQ